ncbi:UbiA family prenyltransferase [Actibacterium sp. 188UL27-1]|nr:UbiA family prenyltransferase [Actibacterium sp. 188UL27-1]
MPDSAQDTDLVPVETVPLVVDLDGTFSRSDTLHEALLSLVAKQPNKLPEIAGWLGSGKAVFKDKVAEEALVDASILPLNQDVVDYVADARAQGRKVLLVSASNQRQVTAVADAADMFDEAVGSGPDRNLAGSNKADWLVERFGENGFDYVGDSSADLKVWPRARRAISVGANSTMQRQVDAIDPEAVHLSPPTSLANRVKVHLKAMRPHQWLKNLLVLVPAFAAHDLSAVGPSLVAFVAFCMAASCIYLINDMLDLEVDRRHPRKRNRPFAAGTIPVAQGAVLAAGLFVGSFLIATLTSWLFVGVLAGYIVLTSAYSLVLKRKLMVDIWMLGALYTLRIIAGGAASGVPLSEWLLAFSMFLFLSLAAVKRQSELADLAKRGMTETDGRGYRVSDQPVILGVVLAAGYCSVLVLALYISGTSVRGLYGEPGLLWLVCPLLLYWISRATMISYRGEMDDDPIVFAIKDRVSQLIFLTCAGLFVTSAVL